MDEIWKPQVAVAAIIERGGRFLLVEGRTEDGARLNQPAGHLEAYESLVDAIPREALEETACIFEPVASIGVYRLPGAGARPTSHGFAFCGTVSEPDRDRALDAGMLRTEWFSIDTIHASRSRHCSPLVLRCIDDYFAGHRFPLHMLHEYTP